MFLFLSIIGAIFLGWVIWRLFVAALFFPAAVMAPTYAPPAANYQNSFRSPYAPPYMAPPPALVDRTYFMHSGYPYYYYDGIYYNPLGMMITDLLLLNALESSYYMGNYITDPLIIGSIASMNDPIMMSDGSWAPREDAQFTGSPIALDSSGNGVPASSVVADFQNDFGTDTSQPADFGNDFSAQTEPAFTSGWGDPAPQTDFADQSFESPSPASDFPQNNDSWSSPSSFPDTAPSPSQDNSWSSPSSPSYDPSPSYDSGGSSYDSGSSSYDSGSSSFDSGSSGSDGGSW